MTAQEFQAHWGRIKNDTEPGDDGKKGSVRTLTTAVETLNGEALSAEAVAAHLSTRGFTVIASGVTEESGDAANDDHEAKGSPTRKRPVTRSRLKVYACRQSQATADKAAATFLMEMVFINELAAAVSSGEAKEGADEKEGEQDKKSTLKLTFKCDDSTQLASFVKRLNLNRLCKGQQKKGGAPAPGRKADL